MQLTVEELVRMVEGRLAQGDPGLVLRAFGGLRECGPDGVSFLGNEIYQREFEVTRAGAVLVRPGAGHAPAEVALIEVDDPVLAFDRVVRAFGTPEMEFRPGIHPAAVIGEGVECDPATVRVDACAVIGDGVRIGEGSWIGPHVSVGPSSRIGRQCRLHDHVTIREGCCLGDRVILHPGVVIGSDGFGYQFKDGRHVPIRQAGIVVLEDDVEIGSNSTVDRARFGVTLIGEGTKIDNLVQIAHNVVLGKHCLVIAQSGISGSARLGDHVTVAAQGGIAGHVTVEGGAVLGGRCGVISDLEGHQTYFGYPARPMREWSRQQMFLKRIPRLLQRIEELEQRLQALEKGRDESTGGAGD